MSQMGEVNCLPQLFRLTAVLDGVFQLSWLGGCLSMLYMVIVELAALGRITGFEFLSGLFQHPHKGQAPWLPQRNNLLI